MSNKNRVCDKCGKPVNPHNDATIIEAVKNGRKMIVFTSQPRHFLPIPGCPGSPSRAQYIQGQSRDPRSTYDSKQESAWRDAYARAQRL
jgi:hypothetical protein